MAYLVLDLDRTTFVTIEQVADIHPAHDLSDKIYVNSQTVIRIINPQLLKNTLEIICEQHEGIIILTNGCWPREIIDIIATHLQLSPASAAKFRQCHFHSLATDWHLFPAGMALEQLQCLTKDIRLQTIIALYPQLQNKKMVALDDTLTQIAALQTMPNVRAICATTDKPEKNFYSEVLAALETAAFIEKAIKEWKAPTVTRFTLFTSNTSTSKRKRDLQCHETSLDSEHTSKRPRLVPMEPKEAPKPLPLPLPSLFR